MRVHFNFHKQFVFNICMPTKKKAQFEPSDSQLKGFIPKPVENGAVVYPLEGWSPSTVQIVGKVWPE